MKRSAPIRRDSVKSRAWANKARKPLRAKSVKRAAARPHELAVTDEVFARDGGCVLRTYPDHVCSGKPQTCHHLSKQSAGGEWTLENCLTLCSGSNEAVENEPEWARMVGLVVRYDITHAEARHRRMDAGLVVR